ncbi:unnamed protein product [Arctia plantaginis]|uniref:Uncharacterized protein n=1 Tax=Arctia plantaginis TaxID=874455 RepID=A0A8S0YL27_ARCPL|nr:unnamed protein product [Arctia plantaginis]
MDDDKLEKCNEMSPAVMSCCTSTHISPEMQFLPEIKECFKNPGHPLSCDEDECLAKKLGYYGDDRKIDREELASLLEKKFENEQLILEAVKKNCLEADISIYGPPMCDLLRMHICIFYQFRDHCTAWSNEGDCQGVKEMIDFCGN